MPTRRSTAHWEGGLKGGKGTFKGESGAIGGQYSFSSRFEEGVGSNPEELLAAAEAACFSMAFSLALAQNGTPPESIDTTASVTFTPGTGITGSHLNVNAVVPGLDREDFDRIAADAKVNCPVSQALAGIEITLEATLA